MKNARTIATILLIVCFFLACEREERELGGKVGPLGGAPEYTQLASVGHAPGNNFVTEVMPKSASGPVDGQALYVKNCSACHQVNGQGIPGAFPPLDNSPYVLNDEGEQMASIVLYGLVGPIEVLGNQFNSAMAPLGAALSDEEIAAVMTYVRSSWSNKAGPVDASVVSEMRKKWGSRGMFAIEELLGKSTDNSNQEKL